MFATHSKTRRPTPQFGASGEPVVANGEQCPTKTCWQSRPCENPTVDAGHSPITATHRSILRIPSSCFQAVKASKPLEIQDSQEQRTHFSPKTRKKLTACQEGIKLKASLMDSSLQSPSDAEITAAEIHHQPPASSDASFHESYGIQETSLSVGTYFSNAVQQLSSPDKGPIATSRRNSSHRFSIVETSDNDWNDDLQMTFKTQQGSHGINVLPVKSLRRARTEQGSLELGISPRLQRSMSNLHFRPPFKALV